MNIHQALATTCILCLTSPCEAAILWNLQIEGKPFFRFVWCPECADKYQQPTAEQRQVLEDLPYINLAAILKRHSLLLPAAIPHG